MMIGAFPMKREDRWVFELVEALVNGGICPTCYSGFNPRYHGENSGYPLADKYWIQPHGRMGVLWL